MLVLNNVSISYKIKKNILPVIRNLSVSIEKGEALAVLGPSGCGKSTLINALAGSIGINCGTVDFITDDIREALNPRIHKIGIIPQKYGLLPWKTVEENCLLPLKLHKEKLDEVYRQEINRIYRVLDIDTLLERYPGELSGGQAQRAAVARAFILKPDLLLMDEPFSSLDEITREEARELFLNIWKHNSPTTILVTHSIEEALYLGNRIVVMGAAMGDIIFEMENPYFGSLYPDSAEYLQIRQMLRYKLIR